MTLAAPTNQQPNIYLESLQMPKEVVEDVPVCTKCGGVLDTENYPRWCKACRAKHRREYEATKAEMTESRGFAGGCSAMRDALGRYFLQFPSAHFSGAEVRMMIGRLPGPEA